MPLYVYRCANCDAEVGKRQGFADPPLTVCEDCGGSLRRVLHPVGVIFKGSGFYSTDYRNGASSKKPAGEATEADSSSKAGSESGTAAKADSSTSKAEGGDKKTPTATTAGKSDSGSKSD